MDLALENLTRRPQTNKFNQNQTYNRNIQQTNSASLAIPNNYANNNNYQQIRRQTPPPSNYNANPNYNSSPAYKPASQPRHQ
jgi:hypothetical protein